eukprot:scaffold18766_cov19-Tisochrysis_lutea.AAC.1
MAVELELGVKMSLGVGSGTGTGIRSVSKLVYYLTFSPDHDYRLVELPPDLIPGRNPGQKLCWPWGLRTPIARTF